jgi:GxxExxY protein
MLIEAPFNAITERILGAAIDVHRTLGPGLLESTYRECLEFELSARQMRFDVERVVPIVYKGTRLRTHYRVDLMVEEQVIVEVKSHATTLAIHEAQVITYLRLTGYPAGLLINFNVPRLMDGVKRLLNPNARKFHHASLKKNRKTNLRSHRSSVCDHSASSLPSVRRHWVYSYRSAIVGSTLVARRAGT